LSLNRTCRIVQCRENTGCGEDLAINSLLRLFPFGNKIIVVRFGVNLLLREALETKVVGGASTVKVETTGNRAFDLDGAQRAVELEADSRKPTANRRVI